MIKFCPGHEALQMQSDSIHQSQPACNMNTPSAGAHSRLHRSGPWISVLGPRVVHVTKTKIIIHTNKKAHYITEFLCKLNRTYIYRASLLIFSFCKACVVSSRLDRSVFQSWKKKKKKKISLRNGTERSKSGITLTEWPPDLTISALTALSQTGQERPEAN